MTVVLCISFVSCDNDDDESVSTSAGVIDKDTGLRIKGFGDYRVFYDEKGRVDYIRDSYDQWSFSYNPNKITYAEIYNGRTSDEETINVSYNSSGFLSSASSSNSYHDEYEKWTESGQMSLSYDSNGHLTKITGSGKESGTEKGEKYSGSWSFTYTLTWRDNLLQQLVCSEKDVEDGELDKSTETWTFSYDNSSYENIYRQWVPSIAIYLDETEEVLAYIGLLGVGPDVLPTSAECDEEAYYDGKTHTYNDSYSFRYGFNGDGSISYTAVNDNRYNFTYDYVETRSNYSVISNPEKEVRHKIHKLFKRSLGSH